MLNHIVLQGRIARDPELRYTPSEIPVCSFTMAVERDRKDADGERKVDFIDCVAWRSTAEFIMKYFSKGSGAALSGRLQIRGWTDKDGNKRRTAEVLVEEIYFGLGYRSEAKKDTGDYYTSSYETGFHESYDDGGEMPF